MGKLAESERRLWVPINIEALVVEEKKTGTSWADLTPDFSWFKRRKGLGSQLAPVLFEEKPSPEEGVHLHWALPDALTHGTPGQARATAVIENGVVTEVNITHGGEGYRTPPKVMFTDQADSGAAAVAEIEKGSVLRVIVTRGGKGYATPPMVDIEASDVIKFPRIPNRWMVQRIFRKPGRKEVSIRAWIVESDYRYRTDGKTKADAVTFPILEAPPLFDYIGKTFDYKEWKETHKAYRIELTCLGYGDPAFAAYYPACRGILGFHDPLSDVEENNRLTYLVAGWYSDSEQDILCHASLEELKWACHPDPVLPEQTLYHGTIYNVEWRVMESKYRSHVPYIDEKNCSIAIGNTSPEALAALLAQRLDHPGIETLLAAFLEDLLSNPTDSLELPSLLHQNRFGSVTGGRLFSIQKKVATDHQGITATDATLPEELERSLEELNALEEEFDRQKRRLDGYRWELYATWYKWALKYLETRQEPGEITRVIDEQKKSVVDHEKKLTALGRARDEKERAVTGLVENQFPDLELVESLAPPFYHPNDPALLISGPGMASSSRHGQDGRYSEKDELQCRVSGQELSGLIVDIPNGPKGNLVAAKDVFEMEGSPFEGGGEVPEGIRDALILEALLLDPGNAHRIAEQAYIEAGLRPPPKGDNKLIPPIQRLQRLAEAKRDGVVPPFSLCFDGAFPSLIALRDWDGNPWLPIFLEWRVSWSSSYSNPEKAIQGWEPGEIDFKWKGVPSTSAPSCPYEGYTILTPHASRRFKECLERYKREKGNADLDPILSLLDDMNVLSQTLGGLNDAFIMRDQVLQIPPISPQIFFGGQKESPEDPIVTFIGEMNILSPDPGKPFYPLRAGCLKVEKLRIVDAFGQALPLPKFETPLRSGSLVAEGEDGEPFLHFPPRLVQPARLLFDWVRTENLPGTRPANSPVCGWVIPNHLDKNLLFYDGGGRPVGALQKILRLSAPGGKGGPPAKDEKAFFWVNMPGTSGRPEDILNPHLRRFVLFLRNMDADPGNAFSDLLDQGINKTDSGEPEDDPVFSVLLGRPLALVRASLKLELEGPPACDQGFEFVGKSETHGFTRIKFPLLLGDAERDQDGLIGFFIDDSGSESSGPFYPSSGAKGPRYAGIIEYGHTLELDCENSLDLTLLMDPRAKVHARTGVLPGRSVELSNRVRSAAQTVREAFFQVAPLVSPGAAVTMPKPSDDYGKWSWAYRPQVTLWKEAEAIGPAGDRAGFHPQPLEISEGWLKLRINPVVIFCFWVKEGMLKVPRGSNITLAWILQGATTLSLLSTEEGKEPVSVKDWSEAQIPQQYQVHVEASTTYILIAKDKAGYRSEKQLAITTA
jgi:hypothetical protein